MWSRRDVTQTPAPYITILNPGAPAPEDWETGYSRFLFQHVRPLCAALLSPALGTDGRTAILNALHNSVEHFASALLQDPEELSAGQWLTLETQLASLMRSAHARTRLSNDELAVLGQYREAANVVSERVVSTVPLLLFPGSAKVATKVAGVVQVVGIANSGMLPAEMISRALGVPVSHLAVTARATHDGTPGVADRFCLTRPLAPVLFSERSDDGDFSDSRERVLLVDDIVINGSTVRRAKQALAEHGIDPADVLVCAGAGFRAGGIDLIDVVCRR